MVSPIDVTAADVAAFRAGVSGRVPARPTFTRAAWGLVHAVDLAGASEAAPRAREEVAALVAAGIAAVLAARAKEGP